MKVVKAHEMRKIDERAINEYGIPSLVLMENAGIRAVEVIEEILENVRGKKVVIIVGKGNNGGDGLVVARHLLNAGAQVDIFILGKNEELSQDNLTNFNIINKMLADSHQLYEEKDLDSLMLALLSADLIVDSIYGIGFKGKLGDFDAKIIKILNWADAPTIALDIPSGVDADTGKVNGEAIQALHTVTFGLPKIGLLLEPGRTYVGSLSVADISIPHTMLEDSDLNINLITPALISPLLLNRSAESHKGTYGHVLVVGGSIGLTGAVVLSSNAALRVGAGLVTAAVPESLLPIVQTNLVEVMTSPLAETGQATIALEAKPALENLLGTVSVCAVGPGMARYPEALAILDFIIKRAGVPIVIDADGLNAIEQDISILKDRQVPIVLTPHPGEMARLMGKTIPEVQADRLNMALELAQKCGVTVVLKGYNTIIATAKGEAYINLNGNPGMATAGSGDVLTGMIAGLIAQGLKPVEAAVTGVFLHGAVGDKVAEVKGQRGMTSGDIINFMPDILQGFE
ncbi:MAG TPA: NAD(P)H-hydrate dehydratase [Syntrophomonadaceae bacterium]|nr:NAD(P)H-hydrate dehydratase [Syntrophomonadaceae bacterium]